MRKLFLVLIPMYVLGMDFEEDTKGQEGTVPTLRHLCYQQLCKKPLKDLRHIRELRYVWVDLVKKDYYKTKNFFNFIQGVIIFELSVDQSEIASLYNQSFDEIDELDSFNESDRAE